MACDEGDEENHCVFTDDKVVVDDGKLTVTGYSHDTGLCHSISMVTVTCTGDAEPVATTGAVALPQKYELDTTYQMTVDSEPDRFMRHRGY